MNNPTLGKQALIPKGTRDAVHVPIIRLRACEHCKPGESVGVDLVLGTTSKFHKPIGIIDPFLTRDVEVGQLVWVLIAPGNTKNLSHNWELSARLENETPFYDPDLDDEDEDEETGISGVDDFDECRGCES